VAVAVAVAGAVAVAVAAPAHTASERLVYRPICIFDVILMCGPHMHKPLMWQLGEGLVQVGPRVVQHSAV
jgi:hypothetical protein